MNANVRFISRNTAAADFFRFYENETASLKRELASLSGKIALPKICGQQSHMKVTCISGHITFTETRS